MSSRQPPPPSDNEIDAHRAACLALVGDTELDINATELAALEATISTRIDRESGLLGRVRSASRPQRVLLVLALSAAVVVVSASLWPRIDWSSYPGKWLTAKLVVLGLLTAAASWHMLRPLHRPPVTTNGARWALLLGLLGPAIFACVAVQSANAAPAGEGSTLIEGAARCGATGLLFGLPLLAAVVLLRRHHGGSMAAHVLAGVIAGLIAYAALEVHCGVVHPLHLLLGHFTLLVLPCTLVAAAVYRRKTRE
jgi:hypothetical protein